MKYKFNMRGLLRGFNAKILVSPDGVGEVDEGNRNQVALAKKHGGKPETAKKHKSVAAKPQKRSKE